MESRYSYLLLLVLLCCCLGGQPETKFICPDGSVASQRSDCPQTEHYVCSNGRVVHDPDECPEPKTSTTLITKYICPDGRVVEDFDECGITSSTTKETASTSTSTTTLPEGGIRIVGLDLGDEWVWLANRDSYMIDLSDWFLRDREDHTYLFPNGFKLMPATSVRVHTGSGIDSPTDLYWGRDGGVWNNKGDTAYLWDSELNLVDELSVGVVEESTTSTTTTSTTTLSTSSSTTSTQTSTSTTSSTTSTTTTTTSTSTTTTSTSTTSITTTTVLTGSVIINEIMFNPARCDDNYCEWIELYNPSSKNVDLSGWTLCDKEILPGYVNHMDSQIYNDQGIVLKSGEYAVITDGGTGTDVYENFDVSSNSLALHVDASSLCKGSLSNTVGEFLDLKSKQGSIIYFIDYYDKTNLANGDGKTLIIDEGEFIGGTVDGGTPGS